MTGFGSGRLDLPGQGIGVEVEISSVNRKTLDAYVNVPREWAGLEQQCQEWLRGAFTRGRVNVQLKASSGNGAEGVLSLSEPALDRSLEALRSYAARRDIPFEPDAALLLELARTLRDHSGLPDWKDHEAAIREAFEAALADLTKMRENEGTALAEDLTQRINELGELVAGMERISQNAPAKHRDALLERLKQLDLELDASDERVLKELAIFADRCDVSEELTRLKSHLAQFSEFIAAAEPTGRKMDFLCQEILREFNTAGSKTGQIELTRAVIEGKNALERIREQVQNIE